MRAAGVTLCLVVIAATASRVRGDELTTEQVVDRMLAANKAWLRAEVDSVSYVLTKHNYGQTIKVFYRAPRDLRADWAPGSTVLLLLNGRGFAAEWQVWPQDWDTGRVRDTAMDGLVFRWGAWALANHRNECKVSELRRERVGGRDAYHLRINGYVPPDFGLLVPPPPWGSSDTQHLWVDAETFRPLRAAHDPGSTPGSPRQDIVRYADYQPFPAGGEAPMRLERWHLREGESLDADPPREPEEPTRYQVVDGKYWFRRLVTNREGRAVEEVSDLSAAPVPASAFEDAALLARLDQALALNRNLEAYQKAQQWEQLYTACQAIMETGVGKGRAAGILHEMCFWHGEYQKYLDLTSPSEHNIYIAWAYDAVGDRERAREAYRRVLDITWPGVAAAAERGLREPWIPVAERLEPRGDERLLTPGDKWRARASVAGESAQAAIDGNRRTRWLSADEQRPGMSFEVDLSAPIPLSRVAFDFAGDLTLEYHGYPRRYRVAVSADRVNWSNVAEGEAPLDNLVEAAFAPRRVRFVRIDQTGSDERDHWSINEILFYAPK